MQLTKKLLAISMVFLAIGILGIGMGQAQVGSEAYAVFEIEWNQDRDTYAMILAPNDDFDLIDLEVWLVQRNGNMITELLLPDDEWSLNQLEWHRNGNLIAIITNDSNTNNPIRIWNTTQLDNPIELQSNTGEKAFLVYRTTSIAWHPLQNIIAVTASSEFHFWDVDTGQLITIVDTEPISIRGGQLYDLDWSIDGERLLVSNPDQVFVFNVADINSPQFVDSVPKQEITDYENNVWSPTQNEFAVANGNYLEIWSWNDNLTEYELTQRFTYADVATDVIWSGKYLAAAVARTGIIVYNSDDWSVVDTIHFPFPPGKAIGFAFIDDGQRLVYANAEGELVEESLDLFLSSPTNLLITSDVLSELQLMWTDNATDETAFHIERALDDGTGNPGTFAEIGTVPADTTTFTDTEPLACGMYYYRVRAFRADDSTFSDYSNMASVEIPCPPATPSNLSGTYAPSAIDLT